MNIRTKRRKHAVSACLLAVIMTAAVLISGIAAQAAADNSVKANHGAVKVYNYDYNALVTRLTAKYPGVFKSATVYSAGTHARVGTTSAFSVLITNSKNHRQGGNSGTTVKYINGSTRSTSNWAQTLGDFQVNEYFMVNGTRGYCFDWTTPSTTGSHVLSASLSEAGISAAANVMELAQAAKMLTENNFALITNNAASIARSLSIAQTTNPDYSWIPVPAVSIAKADVTRLLQDTTADGIAFKRALVQTLVWQKMNSISLSDWMYSLYNASGYYNKEGQWISSDASIFGPVIGIGGIVDFDKMYQLGKTAWTQLSGSASVDHEYQYELLVGVPFTVPSADVSRIVKIVEANGGKIESSGSVTVGVSANKANVTLTATREIPSWTSWLSASESSDMIYSSKPYNASSSGKTGSGLALSVLKAKEYNGQEIGSIQVLNALETKSETTKTCNPELLLKIIKTYEEQYSGWKERSIFERQWVLRDFKKTVGKSAEEVYNMMIKMKDSKGLLTSDEYKLLQAMILYWKHQYQLLQNFEKNKEKLEENNKIILGWISDIEECIG